MGINLNMMAPREPDDLPCFVAVNSESLLIYCNERAVLRNSILYLVASVNL